MVRETVLVTGGCGFVGTRLVAALKGAGHPVRVLDIPRADFSTVEALGAKVQRGSVVDPEAVAKALGNSRVVFHLAAPDPAISDEAFVRKMVVAGAEILTEELEDSRVRHMVAASTTGVHSQVKGVLTEGAPMRPRNTLEVAKHDMEGALEKGARRAGVDVSCLRLANVYGWGDGCIVDRLVPDVRAGGELMMPDGGWVNTVHVADVVAACRRLALPSRQGEGERQEPEGSFRALICVDDHPHQVEELVGTVARLLDVPSPTLRKPGILPSSKGHWARLSESVRFAERSRYSNSRLKRLLGDWPSWPSIDAGLPPELEPPGL